MRDFRILPTYLGTGLRATELTALHLDDVHLEEGYPRVRSGKGNKTRAVNLPPEVARAMARHRPHYRSATVGLHLSVTSAGAPPTYSAIGQLLTRAKRASGLGRVHARPLRHSFGVAALAGGMDLMTLKETLGHADIKMTTPRVMARAERRPLQGVSGACGIATVPFHARYSTVWTRPVVDDTSCKRSGFPVAETARSESCDMRPRSYQRAVIAGPSSTGAGGGLAAATPGRTGRSRSRR